MTTLSSTVGGHTTSIQTATNSINGIQGKYTVKVDNNGYISGFGLISDSNNGTPSSAFIVRADNFKVVMPGYGNYSPFSIGASNVTFNGNTTWSGVTGTGKPLDNSGKVVDLGNGTEPGQRNANDPPSYYPVGNTMQFKWGDSVGITGGGWLTLDTNKHYGDNSGGMMTQWAYGQNGESWKRVVPCPQRHLGAHGHKTLIGNLHWRPGTQPMGQLGIALWPGSPRRRPAQPESTLTQILSRGFSVMGATPEVTGWPREHRRGRWDDTSLTAAWHPLAGVL